MPCAVVGGTPVNNRAEAVSRDTEMPATPAIHFDAPPEACDFLFGSVLGQGSYAKVRWLRGTRSAVRRAHRSLGGWCTRFSMRA